MGSSTTSKRPEVLECMVAPCANVEHEHILHLFTESCSSISRYAGHSRDVHCLLCKTCRNIRALTSSEVLGPVLPQAANAVLFQHDIEKTPLAGAVMLAGCSLAPWGLEAPNPKFEASACHKPRAQRCGANG